jgi:hypothetical protein
MSSTPLEIGTLIAVILKAVSIFWYKVADVQFMACILEKSSQ